MLPENITSPLDLLREDREAARAQNDAHADFACFATVDEYGQPHARFVTMRTIDAVRVTFWSNDTSPKTQQLKSSSRYELTVYWSSLQRQYRLQGNYRWVAASDLPDEYAGSTWRGKVWDWLHQELPQSGPLVARSHLVTRFEQRELELEQQFEDKQSVPPPASAGLIQLEPWRVEVQALDTLRRIHDRRLLVRDGQLWTQQLLIP